MIRHMPMDADTAYATLSYSCEINGDGNSDPSESISINGKAPRIGKNLHQALRCIHCGPEGQLLIWIDAVCIGQSNTDERSEQVARMAKIYRQQSQKPYLAW